MNKKLIVTHIFPDLDAITAVWLISRFDPDWFQAEFEFVASGSTYKGEAVDSDPQVVHVDTGMGRFDHHQLKERTCAAELVFNYLKQEKKISLKYQSGLERLIKIVNQVDQFEDFFWDDPANDRYDFCLHHLFDHLKLSGKLNDKELIAQGRLLLDAVLFGLRQKIKTEEEIKKGIEFETIWGKSLGIESKFSGAAKLAQKQGYGLVIRKEPETGFVAVKCQPRPELDLTQAFEVLKQADANANWYFHQSKHIILNGSRHNPAVKPSRLSLEELIDIFKKIS